MQSAIGKVRCVWIGRSHCHRHPGKSNGALSSSRPFTAKAATRTEGLRTRVGALLAAGMWTKPILSFAAKNNCEGPMLRREGLCAIGFCWECRAPREEATSMLRPQTCFSFFVFVRSFKLLSVVVRSFKSEFSNKRFSFLFEVSNPSFQIKPAKRARQVCVSVPYTHITKKVRHLGDPPSDDELIRQRKLVFGE